MKTNATEESGLGELLRLSREIGNMEKELVQELERARRKVESAEKIEILQSIIKEIKISVVLEQLESVATPEIIEAVSSFKNKQGTAELRKLILGSVSELEKCVDSRVDSNLDQVLIERSVKTLAILIEFLFYLE